MWLSLSRTKVRLPAGVSAALASPTRPALRGTPPFTVHRMPAPAHAMHLRASRRVLVRPVRESLAFVISVSPHVAMMPTDLPAGRFIPGRLRSVHTDGFDAEGNQSQCLGTNHIVLFHELDLIAGQGTIGQG